MSIHNKPYVDIPNYIYYLVQFTVQQPLNFGTKLENLIY